VDNNWNNLDSMSHHTSTKPWALLTNVSNSTGYQYLKNTVGEEIGCPHTYIITEYDTEEELSAAVDALESDGFYMHPNNRIPADTLEEEREREAAYDAANPGWAD